MRRKSIFLSLFISVCCYSTVSEAFFRRNLFGGLFGRREGLPSRRALRNPQPKGRLARNVNPIQNQLGINNGLNNNFLSHNNFIDPRVINLNEFANLGFLGGNNFNNANNFGNVNFPGTGFENNFAGNFSGNSFDSCANQFQFSCNNQDFRQVSCTADTFGGQILEGQGTNLCSAMQSLRQQVCQQGFSTSSLGRSNVICREFQDNTILRQGRFGKPGSDFSLGQVVLGLGSQFDANQIQALASQLGGTLQHQFSNQRGIMVLNVPSGQESSFCHQILNLGLSQNVRSCNPNLFIQNQFESSSSGLFQNSQPFLGGLRRH